MKNIFISGILERLSGLFDNNQLEILQTVLETELANKDIVNKNEENKFDNEHFLELFLKSKQIEGCSNKTIKYYRNTLTKFLDSSEDIKNMTTDYLREYLLDYEKNSQPKKITLDNIRRIISSFFTWLEDENYIVKSPARRIKKIRTVKTVKNIYTDEELEKMRDYVDNKRDLAIIDLLSSTGMRVGELVSLNLKDVNFEKRECIVIGKGNKERVVYFDARTKIHLMDYLLSREDSNIALFVSLNKPYHRLGISGVEIRLKELGRILNIGKVHPHKFRRTLATNAIDKGMPIEQVQILLGHKSIDTTLHYAMIKQRNVKIAHEKYIS